MKALLDNNRLILMEAAIVEPLRRSSLIELHPTLVNAALIYDAAGRHALSHLYQTYMDVALKANVPFLMCTPTWRANQARVCAAGVNQCINEDSVRFMQKLRAAQSTNNIDIKIGGLVGCKHDCYKPYEGLLTKEAALFHAWQIERLAGVGVDFLIAETLPNVGEAKGIAKAMENTGLPYVISFVIARDGRILDGTPLSVAVEMIDSAVSHKPLGYMVNCAYPTFLRVNQQPSELFSRMIGFLANSSSLDHSDLDGAAQLETEPVSDWGKSMLELNARYGVKVLGGCCGTSVDHLRYLVDQ